MFARFGLRQKMLLVYILSVVIPLALGATIYVFNSATQSHTALESRIRNQGALAAVNLQSAMRASNWSAAQQVISTLAADPAIMSVGVFDKSGTERARLIHDTPLIATDGSQPGFEVVVSITDGDTQLGLLFLNASNQEVVATVWTSMGESAILVFLLLGASALFIKTLLGTINGRRLYSTESRAVAKSAIELVYQESQLRFEKAFEHAPNGMAFIDADGQIMQRNAVFDRLLGSGDQCDLNLKTFIDSDEYTQLGDQLMILSQGRASSMHWETNCRSMQGSEVQCVLGFSAIRNEVGEFMYIVLQVQDVTEARRLSDELNYQASHDALTGLANRRTFEAALIQANERSAESDYRFSLCLIDLDQFKVVNDTAGHAAGDELLQQIATILIDTVRPEDLVVRLGGDEFAVLLENCEMAKARGIAEAIRATIHSQLFEWNNSVFRIGASVGVVEVKAPVSDISNILRDADLACFAAKDAGRNQVHAIEQDRKNVDKTHGEMHWVHRIHRALEADDFMLYAQPIVPLQGQDEPQRLEILVRLKNWKTGTLYPPGAFLPAAERYDLITQIDEWVVTNVVKTLQTYKFLFDESRTYWINLSGRSIGDDRFLDFLEEIISNAQIPSGVINFEITETAVIRNIKSAVSVMQRLKNFGCHFALDDFGTGLSSFSYLKSLPVDYIKIDGMFVREVTREEVDRIFVKSIIDIAKSMNIKSVVEFVESDAIAETATLLGADYGQGFALGRPSQLLPEHAMQIVKESA